ncbi:MAG: RNB domain-containing ribonuclease [Deltaproteobacteria bacterium]|jgi:exoribonuclease-2|nr:RNB domain-containing ribonuclease [Deltaproteobacteria bacterium]
MIVEFLEDNLFIDGWVLDSAANGRLEVMADGKPVKIHPKRALVTSDAPDPGTADGRLSLLARTAARRASLAAEVDLETIWGLLEEEREEAVRAAEGGPEGAGPSRPGGGGASEPYAYAALAELEFGRGADADQTAAMMRAVHRDGLYFKFTPEEALKRSREEIERILEIRAREIRKAELRREGIAWLRRARLAYYGEGPGGARRDAPAPQSSGAPDASPGTDASLSAETNRPADAASGEAAPSPGASPSGDAALPPEGSSPADDSLSAPYPQVSPPAEAQSPADATRSADSTAPSVSASTSDASPSATAPDTDGAERADGTGRTDDSDGTGRADDKPAASDGPEADEIPAFPPPPDDGGILVKTLTELALAVDDPPPALKGAAEALIEAGFSGDAAGAARALEATGIFRPHEDLELRRLGLPLEFPQEVLDEAERLLADEAWLGEDRLDLTGELIVTVDSPGAMEFDDAVSLAPNAGGGLTLGLHIADASAFVAPGSALDRFAAERGASIYLPECRHPMLPLSLTQNALSLTAGQVRPAFSILCELGEDGQVTDAVFRPSLIKVARHLTFAEADEALAGGGDRELAPLLTELAGLSQKFQKRRVAAGGHVFNIPGQQVSLDERGDPVISLVDWDTPACVAVGELMITANHLAASTLRNSDFPCPYRYQIVMKGGQSPPRKPAKTPGELLAWHLALRRRLGRTGVGAEPVRHRGLGLDCYTYFTSPMRRYFDLLVHRQLRALAAGEGPAYDEKSLMGEAYNADGALRAIHKVQSARTRYWILHVLSGRVGETFRALCFDRQGRRVRVCLTDWMMETESMGFPDSVEPGHDLEVRLMRADPAKKALECAFVANLTLDASNRA